jgi:hypothetical protein
MRTLKTLLLLILIYQPLFPSTDSLLYVTVKSAKLLHYAWEDSPAIVELPFGTRLKYLSTTEEWYQVKLDSLSGYINTFFAKPKSAMSADIKTRLDKALAADKPLVKIYPDSSSMERSDSLRLYAIYSDGLGEIISVEWKIGDMSFINTDTRDIMIKPPANVDSTFIVIVRVTDNDNNTSSDTSHIRVMGQPAKQNFIFRVN